MLALNRKEFIVFLQKTESKIRMEGREKYLTFLGLVSAVFFLYSQVPCSQYLMIRKMLQE